MYSFVDRPVACLGQGSRFILWATRAWARAAQARTCPPGSLAPAFAKMGLLNAVPDFHLMLATFNRDAVNHLMVAPINAPRIAEDEALLLGLWRDTAAGDAAKVRKTLAMMLGEAAIDTVAAAMTRVSGMLTELDIAPSGVETDEERLRG